MDCELLIYPAQFTDITMFQIQYTSKVYLIRNILVKMAEFIYKYGRRGYESCRFDHSMNF